jgi:hypothetical protein
VRKLLIGARPCQARINIGFYRAPAAAVKSDRLLECRAPAVSGAIKWAEPLVALPSAIGTPGSTANSRRKRWPVAFRELSARNAALEALDFDEGVVDRFGGAKNTLLAVGESLVPRSED